MHKNMFETALAEARYDAETYKAFRDDDVRLGDIASAERWNRLYLSACVRVRMYEMMTYSGERRVG